MVSTTGSRAGMATCFTRQNVHRVDEVIQLAKDLGCSTFAHFNFILVGRGREIAAFDLTSAQRENLLARLNQHLQQGEISIISTAPQFGRACLLHAGPGGLIASAHVGSGKGKQTRVLARYIGGCGAGRCYCAIQPNGKVTPCVYIPSPVMGDLRTQSFEQLWNNPQFAVLADREDHGDHCGGRRARALSYTGDLQAGDPGCMYNIHLWEEITNSPQAEPAVPRQNAFPDDFLPGMTSGKLPSHDKTTGILLRGLESAIPHVVIRTKSGKF